MAGGVLLSVLERREEKPNHIPLSGLCLCLQGECEELERQVDARCDALIRSIERRRQWLIDAVRQDKEIKQRSLKDHVTSCTCKLQKTTSLLQFCIEALKENDPVSFLQVSNHAISILNPSAGHSTRCSSPTIQYRIKHALHNYAIRASYIQHFRRARF